MDRSHDKELTTRDRIFQYVVRYKRDHDGNTPSTREIADACCVTTSTVNYHLLKLEVAGQIRVSGRRRRNIEIVGANWDYESAQETREAPAPSAEEQAGEDDDDHHPTHGSPAPPVTTPPPRR